jgi:murein lipoprotein
MVLSLASVLALGVIGCATSGDLEALTERVSRLESQAESNTNRIGALEQRFDDVAAAADRSVERASEAEARARAAESRADDAARKADAIFRKSVSK